MEVFFIKNSSPFSFASWSLYKSNEPRRRIESCQFMVLRFPHSSLTLYLQLIILKCFKKLLTALKSKLKMIFVVCWQFVFSQLHWNVNKSSDDTDFFISFIWQAIINCCFRSVKADKKKRHLAVLCIDCTVNADCWVHSEFDSVWSGMSNGEEVHVRSKVKNYRFEISDF